MSAGEPPALIAVAHGSRDPRSAATITRLVEQVRQQRPDLAVRLSFLDLSTPRLPNVLAAVAGDGHRHAVVVPLLLDRAFHAKVDLPGALAKATGRHPGLRLSVADVLGGDHRLAQAALRRLSEVAGPLDAPELGVVLAAIGSSRPDANVAVLRLASRWARQHGWAGALAAFGTSAEPSVPSAISRLRERGAERIAVASWFLAPGLIPTRVATTAADFQAPMAAPLGPDPLVAEVIVDRYLATAGQLTAAVA